MKISLDIKNLINIYKLFHVSRYLDELTFKWSRQSDKGSSFQLSCKGHELVGIIAAKKLISKKDWAFPYYRDQAFVLSLGCDSIEILGAFLARDMRNHSSGRMMPYHYSSKELRICCQSSVIATQVLHAVGRAWGIKKSKKEEVVYVSLGDGATSQGDFYESLNFASIHQLPIIFVIQNNNWAISVSLLEQCGGKQQLINRIRGYSNLDFYEVEGNDYFKLDEVFSTSIEKARTYKKPSVILTNVVRLAPHSNSDDPKKYKEACLLQEEKNRDPELFLEEILLEHGLDATTISTYKEAAFFEVQQAAKKAEELSLPTRGSSSLHVFSPYVPALIDYEKEDVAPKKMSMRDAISAALQEEMVLDSQVVVFGEDVAGAKGGVFGITRGLTEKFGKDRCFNTPLAESTIIGVAAGMAFDGVYRPVAEIQFADYIWPGINQLFSEISSIHYRSNGEWTMPLVIRMPCGGYIQGGPYHSQCIEGFLAHCPGLKIAFPSNASDAKALLKTAIRDPNPVIFLEHKALYQKPGFCSEGIFHEGYLLSFGSAAIVHKGRELTIVSWGKTLVFSLEIAIELEKEGISVEVIDLRTLVPCDFATIFESVKKTGKLLVIHEAPEFCGFGSEIVARVSEEVFSYLDAPIKRVCGLNTPVPYSKILEAEVLPQKETIEKSIRDLIKY